MRFIYGKLELVACLGALVVSLGACGSAALQASSPFDDEAAAAPDFEQGSPDRIVRSEIQRRGSTDQTAMALIRRLRPAWLSPRGQTSFNDPGTAYPLVYIDEIRHGGLNTLNHIPSTEILRMEFFSTADATTRWGTGHPSGVINIVTGR